MHRKAQREGLARFFCPDFCSLCGPVAHTWRLPVSTAEGKAWNASVRKDYPCQYADIAYWHRPTLGSGIHKHNLRLTTFGLGRRTAEFWEKIVTAASQVLKSFSSCYRECDDSVRKDARWPSRAPCLQLSPQGHKRACDDGPQITLHRGSPTYTVFFLSHVTCHPFPSPQPASNTIVTAHPLQRTGHGPYRRVGREGGAEH